MTGAVSEYAIEFEGVSFSYKTGTPALQGVSLRVRPGEFVAVVGANGSGKSTLAKHVNALLVPDEGAVRVAGFDTSDASRALDVRRRAGMVFQNPDNQSVASIVRDDVAFGPENLGAAPDEVRDRVAEALGAVGMGGHADDEVHALSGGQKQLVAIAGVLAMRPEILVLDEPAAMLDVRGRAAVMRIVGELHEGGLTVVLVTHFMEDAARADRVIALDAGHVAFDGEPEAFFGDVDRLRDLGLEPPFPVRLAHELRGRGIPLRADAGFHEAAFLEELCRMGQDCARKGSDFAVLRNGGMESAPEDGPDSTESCDMAANPAIGRSPSPVAPRRTAKSEQEQRDACLVAPVRFDNVGFSYEGPGAPPAIGGLSFELRKGEILGIVGHTGSGKSTVTQLMNALLVPTAGNVVVDGMSTAERKLRRKVRSRVGLVFQYPEAQLFETTVAGDVAFGPRNLGLGKDEVQERCERALERVGLPYGEFAERSPFVLSGGQQRRVAIAGVLAMDPEVLVLDEPAAGLDPRGAREMRSLLRRLNAEGTTVALVSHSMDEVAEVCDRVLVLDAGRRLALGTPAEVFSAENARALDDAGLGLPHATRFALELARRGLVLDGPVLTESQLADALCDGLGRKA